MERRHRHRRGERTQNIFQIYDSGYGQGNLIFEFVLLSLSLAITVPAKLFHIQRFSIFHERCTTMQLGTRFVRKGNDTFSVH